MDARKLDPAFTVHPGINPFQKADKTMILMTFSPPPLPTGGTVCSANTAGGHPYPSPSTRRAPAPPRAETPSQQSESSTHPAPVRSPAPETGGSSRLKRHGLTTPWSPVRRILRLVTLLGSLCLAVFATAQLYIDTGLFVPATSSHWVPPRQSSAAFFATMCASCHGAAGRADGPLALTLTAPPPDLTRPRAIDADEIQRLTRIVLDGSGQMPAFGAALDAATAQSLVTYLLTLQPKEIKDEKP